MKISMIHRNLKKILRYLLMYGLLRTIYKMYGRTRGRFIYRPSNIGLSDIAIIGCGQFGFATIAFFVNKYSGHRFVRAFDTDIINQESFQKFNRIKQATATVNDIYSDESVKLIYIASNHSSHTSYAIEALNSGKDVYIEKPISVSYEQLSKLLQVMRMNPDRRVFVGYNRPFSKAIKCVREKIQGKNNPISLNIHVSGHKISADHWYRKPKEGTRICGNMGHWIDLSSHLFYARGCPPTAYDIKIGYADPNENDDNITVVISTDCHDIVSIMMTSRSEPFEGINETINMQCGETIVKIDDFMHMTIWANEKKEVYNYAKKDVGHKRAILQPYTKQIQYTRNFEEIIHSTIVMLNIAEMVRNRLSKKAIVMEDELKKVNMQL
jgi:predicted dehydrogenase